MNTLSLARYAFCYIHLSHSTSFTGQGNQRKRPIFWELASHDHAVLKAKKTKRGIPPQKTPPKNKTQSTSWQILKSQHETCAWSMPLTQTLWNKMFAFSDLMVMMSFTTHLNEKGRWKMDFVPSFNSGFLLFWFHLYLLCAIKKTTSEIELNQRKLN